VRWLASMKNIKGNSVNIRDEDDVFINDINGKSYLSIEYAIRNERIDLVSMLLVSEKQKVVITRKHLEDAFVYGIVEKKLKSVRFMLEFDPSLANSIVSCDSCRATAFSRAILACCNDTTVLKMLISSGAVFDVDDDNHLRNASEYGALEAANILLEKGVKINSRAPNIRFLTPLDLALEISEDVYDEEYDEYEDDIDGILNKDLLLKIKPR